MFYPIANVITQTSHFQFALNTHRSVDSGLHTFSYQKLYSSKPLKHLLWIPPDEQAVKLAESGKTVGMMEL